MLCKDIMTTNVFTCDPQTTAAEAASILRDHRIGFLPVVDPEKRLLGVVTDRDLATRVLAAGLAPSTPVRELMTTEVICCRGNDDTLVAEDSIVHTRRGRVVIVDDENKVLGILSLTDVSLNQSPIRAGRLLHAIASRKSQSGSWRAPSGPWST